MKHLTTEELLLIADGELSTNRMGHLDECVECRESLGALQGELTMISSALTAPVAGDTGTAKSWDRLELAMSEISEAQDLHLSPAELLLLIDGELADGRAAHAQRCAGCGSARADVQHLLLSVESDLRAMAPSEPLERRVAAEQALKLHLYASQPKVIAFPSRLAARYAAAAAALISVASGGWLWNQAPTVNETVAVAEARPAVAPAFVSTRVAEPEVESVSLETPAGLAEVAAQPLLPVRFEFVNARLAAEPTRLAVTAAEPALSVEASAPAMFAFASVPTVTLPLTETIEVLESDAYLAVLEARQWQLDADLWREDVRAVWTDAGLAFAGSLESNGAREMFIAAMERRSAGREVSFDLAVRDAADVTTRSVDADHAGTVGGLVRTALMEHYRDAARRSFQPVEISALESEIARYVSEVFRNQNDLVGHAYQLDQLLNHSPVSDAAGNAAANRAMADLIRFHIDGINRSEARIYDHLSEALPRRYWRDRSDNGYSPANSGDLGAESSALLDDVLGLERTLSAVLAGSQQTVAFGEAGTSSGELLRRIHDRLSRIRQLSRAAL